MTEQPPYGSQRGVTLYVVLDGAMDASVVHQRAFGANESRLGAHWSMNAPVKAG